MEYIRDFQAAERNAAAVMRGFGFRDAVTSRPGADGGLDVVAGQAVAQVKWHAAAAGRPELQRLYGARGSRVDQELFFFSAAGFSREAVQYADQHGVHLFVYDALGEVEPRSASAHRIVRCFNGRVQDVGPSDWSRWTGSPPRIDPPIRPQAGGRGGQAVNSIVLGMLLGTGGVLALGAAVANGKVVLGIIAALFTLACVAAVVGGILMLRDRRGRR